MAPRIRNLETEAATKASRDRLSQLEQDGRRPSLADGLDQIARHCALLPVLDPRPADEILGYDEH